MTPPEWWQWMGWFPIVPLFFMALCFVMFLFVMVPMMRRHGPWGYDHGGPSFPHKTALDILNERFARGEIDKMEYDEIRRVIS